MSEELIVQEERRGELAGQKNQSGMAVDERESELEKRRKELEDGFSFDGYFVARKELFAHLREPSITVRPTSIQFNTACIKGLEDTVYIQIHVNPVLKRMVVCGCQESDKDALRWCIAKGDTRKPREMKGRDFCSELYDLMGWDKENRYKMLGFRIEFEGQPMYIFDLTVYERFSNKKRTKITKEEREQQNQVAPGETAPTVEPDPRRGYFPDDIAHTFGMPVEEHRRSTELHDMNGFMSMEAITGSGSDTDPASGGTVSEDPAADSMQEGAELETAAETGGVNDIGRYGEDGDGGEENRAYEKQQGAGDLLLT